MKPIRFQEYEHDIKVGLLEEVFEGVVEYEMDPDGEITLLRVLAYISPKRGEAYYDAQGERVKWPQLVRQPIRLEFVTAQQKAEWKREIALAAPCRRGASGAVSGRRINRQATEAP